MCPICRKAIILVYDTFRICSIQLPYLQYREMTKINIATCLANFFNNHIEILNCMTDIHCDA